MTSARCRFRCPFPQCGAEFFGLTSAVDEDEPLLAGMQGGNHLGGVGDRADVVHRDIR